MSRSFYWTLVVTTAMVAAFGSAMFALAFSTDTSYTGLLPLVAASFGVTVGGVWALGLLLIAGVIISIKRVDVGQNLS